MEKMIFKVISLYPDVYNCFKNLGIIRRAIEKGIVEINAYNLRDFSEDKHRKVDDYPYGGGAGMVLRIEPIYNAIKTLKSDKTHIILLNPIGSQLTEKKLSELSKKEEIMLICGYFEGFDHRVYNFIDESLSIGDYVLSNGDIPAMVIMDGIIRRLKGVIGNEASLEEESFEENLLLEYPQWTRPPEFMGYKVPEILLSGNHKEIAKWREQQRIELTKKYRKELYLKYIKEQKQKQ
jgi:tRNA (guanine37-N1)-methyltransferase